MAKTSFDNFEIVTDDEVIEQEVATEEAASKNTYDHKKYEEWKAKQNEKKLRATENFKRLKQILIDNNLWDGLAPDLKEFIVNEGKDRSKLQKVSLLNKLFPVPQVGQSVTLLQAMTTTLKGKHDIDKSINYMKAHGWSVEFQNNSEDPLNSLYVLKEYPL